MKRIQYLIAFLILLGCSSDDSENTMEVFVTDIQYFRVQLNWTLPSASSGNNVYEIVLNGQILEPAWRSTEYVVDGLLPETNYQGLIKALDDQGNTTFGEFNFTTISILESTAYDGDYFLRSQSDVEELGNSNITEIAGILEISGDNITDLSTLSRLSQVEGLVIGDTSVETLAGLNNLSVVGEESRIAIINDPLLNDITALQNATASRVDIWDCPSLINPEGPKTSNGGRLVLINTGIVSMQGINIGSELKELRMEENTDLVSLEGLENLQYCSYLKLSDSWQMQSLQGLNGLLKVDKLELRFLPGLDNFNGLSNLQEVGMNPQIDWGGEAFYLQDVGVTNLSGFDNLTHVRNLWISDCDYMNSLNGSAITNSWEVDSARRIRIVYNDQLTDFCGLREYANNTDVDVLWIRYNAYNPNLEELRSATECSQ